MTPERSEQIRNLFAAALERDTGERPAFLAEVCQGDKALYDEVRLLLEADTVTRTLRQPPGGGPRLESIATAPSPGDRIDAYRLVSVLGAGGMGIVYLAEQERPLLRQVALKLIKPGVSSRDAVARFDRERQALAVMEHPNIARVYNAGATDSGQPYFVMEYVPGSPITVYCDQHTLATRDRLKLFRHVCLAIHHAHQKGVIHLDMKPSNVLVTEQDGEPVPKVIDFGVAKAIHQRQVGQTLFTQTGVLAGTPEYMSPEQANLDSVDIDASSDVYSLGVLLYELLVGALPFDPRELRRKGLLEILRAIREDDPKPLSSRLKTLPTASEIAQRRDTSPGRLHRQLRGDLDWIAMRAMEKDRGRRYNSAAEFAGDIERYLNNEPVLASPPSRSYRLKKFVSKNRWPVMAAAAAALLALCAGLTLSTFLYLMAESARREAGRQREEAQRRGAEAVAERIKAGQQADRATAASAIAEARQKEAQRQLLLNTWQSAARQAANDAKDHIDDERAALLARQAMLLHAMTPEEPRRLVEDAVQTAANLNAFSHVLRTPVVVSSVTFAPDGNHLACGDFALSDALIFDLSEPNGPAQILSGRESAVTPLAAAIRRSGTALYDSFPGTAVAFAPDGNRLASVSPDGIVHIWDLHQPKAPPQVLAGPQGTVSSVAFASDGNRIASAGSDGLVRIWDLRKRDTPPQILAGHQRAVSAVTFAPDGDHIASAGVDGTVRIWDLRQPNASPQVLPNQRVRSVAFAPDGNRLAAAGSDWIIRIWNLRQPEAPPQVLSGHQGEIRSVAFSPDGNRLASASSDHTLRIWNVAPGYAPVFEVLAGHLGSVASVAFSPDGNRLASASQDQTVRIWDLHPAKSPIQILAGSSGGPLFVTFAPRGNRLASGGRDGTVRVWDLHQANNPPRVLSGHVGNVFAAAFDPDGNYLASGGDDGAVRIWNLRQANSLPQVLSGHEGSVRSVLFSPDGNHLVSGTDGTLRLWDLREVNRPFRVLSGPKGSVRSVAFTRDGKHLASVGVEGTVRIWDLSAAKAAPEVIRGQAGSALVALAPDGNRFAVVSADGAMRTWDLRQSSPAPQVLPGQGPVFSVAFAPDGDRIVFSRSDGTLSGSLDIWDLRQPNAPPQILSSSGSPVLVAFAPDGNRLAVASNDVRILPLWSATADYLCTRVWRNLSLEEWRLYIGEGIPYERTCPQLPAGTGAPVGPN